MEALIILFLVGIVSIVPEFLFPEEDPNYEKFLKSPKCPKIIFGKWREYEFPNNEYYQNKFSKDAEQQLSYDSNYVLRQRGLRRNMLSDILVQKIGRKTGFLYQDEIEHGYGEQILFFAAINQLDNCPALQKIRERDEHAKAEYEKWLQEKNVITDKQEVANND